MATEGKKENEAAGLGWLEKSLLVIGAIFIITFLIAFLGDPLGTNRLILAGSAIVFAVGLIRALEKKFIDAAILIVVATALNFAELGIANRFAVELSVEKAARIKAEQYAAQLSTQLQVANNAIAELQKTIENQVGMKDFIFYLQQSRFETWGLAALIGAVILGFLFSVIPKKKVRIAFAVLSSLLAIGGSCLYMYGGYNSIQISAGILNLSDLELYTNLVGKAFLLAFAIIPTGLILFKYRRK